MIAEDGGQAHGRRGGRSQAGGYGKSQKKGD